MMKSYTFFAFLLLAFTSCQKEPISAQAPTEITPSVTTKVAYSSIDSVKNLIAGKWSWKGSISNGRGQAQQTQPDNGGLKKIISLNNITVTTFENGIQTASEIYSLRKTDSGWWFESSSCSGIVSQKGQQLVIIGSVVDRDDNYFDRAQ